MTHSATFHITILTLVAACAAMGMKDLIGTVLNIAENNNKPTIAAISDGAMDIATVMVNAIGVGAVLTYGWNPKTIAIMAVMTTTSIIGTYYWTKASNKWVKDDRWISKADFNALSVSHETLQREMQELKAKVGFE